MPWLVIETTVRSSSLPPNQSDRYIPTRAAVCFDGAFALASDASDVPRTFTENATAASVAAHAASFASDNTGSGVDDGVGFRRALANCLLSTSRESWESVAQFAGGSLASAWKCEPPPHWQWVLLTSPQPWLRPLTGPLHHRKCPIEFSHSRARRLPHQTDTWLGASSIPKPALPPALPRAPRATFPLHPSASSTRLSSSMTTTSTSSTGLR